VVQRTAGSGVVPRLTGRRDRRRVHP
jgi:hypothetical protein